jgi:hypothetical protein
LGWALFCKHFLWALITMWQICHVISNVGLDLSPKWIATLQHSGTRLFKLAWVGSRQHLEVRQATYNEYGLFYV